MKNFTSQRSNLTWLFSLKKSPVLIIFGSMVVADQNQKVWNTSIIECNILRSTQKINSLASTSASKSFSDHLNFNDRTFSIICPMNCSQVTPAFQDIEALYIRSVTPPSYDV